MSAQVIPFPTERVHRPVENAESITLEAVPATAEQYLKGYELFERTHGRPPCFSNQGEWNAYISIVTRLKYRVTAKVLPFRFNPRRAYPVVRDRTGMQAVDELIAAHLGLESAGAFKGVEARFGAPYERLPEAQAQEALRWGIQAQRGALAVRQFLKELEGRFLESLAEQLAPPKPRARRKPTAKARATKGGEADA